MRGRIGPGSLLLVSAAAVAVLVGSIVGQQVMRARSGDGAGASGMLASISDDLADMPEVWSLTELGDELPGGDTMTAAVPV
ncbi:MAG: hypothetical protein HYY42_06625, partial [Chloroflexi bacterium]|nr:hypothetical protein [Chloroflexota bacterium]